MNLPETSWIVTRGILAVASFSLVAFYIGPFEGILVFLIMVSILINLLQLKMKESEMDYNE